MMSSRTGCNAPLPTYTLAFALVFAVIVPQIGVGISVPALPDIAFVFDVSISAAQGTLIIYMAGYAVSMLGAGLLSDRFGPRQVQLWGLGLAGAAALLAAGTEHIATFYLARFVQALGGCVGTVTTRLIVSQHYAGHERMKILTTLASAIAITPCLAPLAGGALLPYVGWRGVFVVTALISFGTLIFFWLATGNTAPHQKQAVPLSTLGAIYARNLRTPRFVLYAVGISFVWMTYFAFVSCSSGPLQIHMGLSALHYGGVLGLAALGYVAGSQMARRLAHKHDIDLIIGVASWIGLAGGVLLVSATAIWPGQLLTILVPTSAILFATGMVIPATQAGLLKYATQDAGVSSGLFFFLQMVAGALWAALGNLWQDMTPLVLAALVAIPAITLPWLLQMLGARIQRIEA